MSQSFYDAEAADYDETRGGDARARAAAHAISDLVGHRGTALDLAGGTGSVSVHLAAAGWSVLVVDFSLGMLRLAADRLPGRVCSGDATHLPVRSAAVELVVVVWLLHMMSVAEADAVLRESARVLRPGGHLVTTVDKDLAHGATRDTDGDHRPRLEAVAGVFGFDVVGSGSFSGRSKWGSAGAGDAVFPLLALRRR